MSKKKSQALTVQDEMTEFLLYTAPGGGVKVEVFLNNETIWLPQERIAELFGVQRPAITKHLKNIFDSGELEEKVVCSKMELTTKHGAVEGKTQTVFVKFYNLDAIISVGYRVNSSKATQFRIWATHLLKEYIIKGFAMDDERLKQAKKWDYFDEWLARIRDIRASEKRFYQKIKDLYATAVDYDKSSEQAKLFFKKVQNKMLWAVTGKTAAEIIADRSDSNKANMGLTSFRGSVVRKGDIATSKNYLQHDEIDELNRIVTMYLDYAEDQARKRKTMSMAAWADKLDSFLEFNERDLLTHAGKLKMEVAQQLATKRYHEFDAKRRKAEAIAADEEDIKEIEALEKKITKHGAGEGE